LNHKARLFSDAILRRENSMIPSDDRTSKDALLNTLGDELAAAWARFYATEVGSRPGELEYDRALAAAKKLEAAIVEIVAGGRRPEGDWPF
jgi:CelD/BcsL family acetyltransferase involved in cellulose biosynthesis